MDAILSKRYFQTHFVNGFYFILINISLKFVPNGRIDNNPALIQIIAWRWTGDKPLPEPMMAWFADAYMRHTASNF